jgi:hypothetical protein
VTGTQTNSTGAANCASGNDHVQINVNSGSDPTGMNTASGICNYNGWGNSCGTAACTSATSGANCTPNYISFGEVVRYRIRTDAAGVPVLQRFTTADVASGFQPVATGIEELQVQYLQQNGNPPADDAPAVVNTDHTSLITEVRVTLSARSQAGNLQGQTGSATGGNALRGRLVSAGAPRTALVSLTQASPAPLWK